MKKKTNELPDFCLNCGATLDGVVAFSMKQIARKALEGEK